MTPDELEKLRQNLLHQTDHRCCKCQTEDNLQIHHIDGDHDNNDVNNLAVLCIKHHDAAHYGGGNFYLKLKPDAIKKYMRDWTNCVKQQRKEYGVVHTFPKIKDEQLPPNHTKYEAIDDCEEDIEVAPLFLSLLKVIASIFIFSATVYIINAFDLYNKDWLINPIVILAGILMIGNSNNIGNVLLLYRLGYVRPNHMMLFNNYSRLITVEDGRYFFFKVQAPCIAPKCNGHVTPAIPPAREQHRGIIGLCNIGRHDHAYTLDANGIGERITLDRRPIEQNNKR